LIQYRQSRPWLCYAWPCQISHGTLTTHDTHNGVDTITSAALRAAKYIKLSPFSTSLESPFSDTRGSLNFLTVYSCSQNLPLIGCMYASKFQRRLTLLCLISVSGVKHVSALLAKNFQRRPPIFLHVFGRASSDLQLCFVQLKTLAPSARYSTFEYPVTLKPGLGVTQGHRKL